MKQLIAVLAVCCLPYAKAAEVSVNINADRTLSFEQRPRLLQVLEQSGFDQYTYWPEAKLFRLDSVNRLQPVKQRVLIMLQALASVEPVSVGHFYRYIEKGRYTERINIPLDIDLARTRAMYNPLVDKGEYQLELSARSGTVRVLGAVEQPSVMALDAKMQIADYVAAAGKSKLADNSIIWLISPDGKVQRHGVAYWNKAGSRAAGGSIIYVPFAAHLKYDVLEQLNQSVLELLLNRVDL